MQLFYDYNTNSVKSSKIQLLSKSWETMIKTEINCFLKTPNRQKNRVLGETMIKTETNCILKTTKTPPLNRQKKSWFGYNFRGGARPIFTQRFKNTPENPLFFKYLKNLHPQKIKRGVQLIYHFNYLSISNENWSLNFEQVIRFFFFS